MSISIYSDSRLKSSLTLKVRKRRPEHSASAMKSADGVASLAGNPQGRTQIKPLHIAEP